MFSWLERRQANRHLAQQRRQLARQLYDRIVAQARHADFYRQLAVPDTVRGRFEMLAMHMFLVLDRLQAEPDRRHEALAQDLVDIMFDDMDDVARELGVGDMAVAPRIKKLARSFRSRLEAYGRALADSDAGRLPLVVGEILFDKEDAGRPAAILVAFYLRRQRARLAAMPAEALVAGVGDLFDAPLDEQGTGGDG